MLIKIHDTQLRHEALLHPASNLWGLITLLNYESNLARLGMISVPAFHSCLTQLIDEYAGVLDMPDARALICVFFWAQPSILLRGGIVPFPSHREFFSVLL